MYSWSNAQLPNQELCATGISCSLAHYLIYIQLSIDVVVFFILLGSRSIRGAPSGVPLPIVTQIGEVLDNRYEVTEFKGKGVFSTVMRARDHGVGRGAAAAGTATGPGPEVAIKVIRANETMYKAAQMEQTILRKLSSSDPENRKHCIRMLRAFEFRKHMCLVFEPMVRGSRATGCKRRVASWGLKGITERLTGAQGCG